MLQKTPTRLRGPKAKCRTALQTTTATCGDTSVNQGGHTPQLWAMEKISPCKSVMEGKICSRDQTCFILMFLSARIDLIFIASLKCLIEELQLFALLHLLLFSFVFHSYLLLPFVFYSFPSNPFVHFSSTPVTFFISLRHAWKKK